MSNLYSGACGRHLARLCFLGMPLFLGGCGGGPAFDWKPFQNAEAGFSVEFPGPVETPQNVDKAGTGGPQIYRFECRPKDSAMMFGVTFIEQANSDERIATYLEEVEARKLEPGSSNTSSETKRVQLGNINGVEHVLVKDKEIGKSFQRYRVYCAPWGDYTVVADSVTSADAYTPEVERFFNSFKINRTK